MIFFDIDEKGLITPKDEKLNYYWFDSKDLAQLRSGTDGCHEWFLHLSEKRWFTEDMFHDLLAYAKQIFPQEDFSKTQKRVQGRYDDARRVFCRKALCEILQAEIAIAVANGRSVGLDCDTCYQVMADAPQEEVDFWNWYCDKHENAQFFENIYECIFRYLLYRDKWFAAGKPKCDYENERG